MTTNAATSSERDASPMTHETDMRLRGLPLAVAKVIWLLVTAGVIALDLAGLPATYATLQVVCSSCQPGNGPPTPSQASILHAMGISLQFWAICQTTIIGVAMFVYVGTGVLLFLRRSDERMAFFASLMLVTFGGGAFTGWMQALPNVHPALWLPVYIADILGQITFVVFFVIFPDGRFVPRWIVLPVLLWSFSWLTGLFRNPVFTQFDQLVNSGPLFPVIIASVIVAQVYRYWRVSTPRQRKQTKWVVYGFSLGIGGFLLLLLVGNEVLPSSVHNNPIMQLIADGAIYICFLFIPAAIAIAILRSGLWDIDTLINRTLVYGSLTVILAAIYFTCVIGAQAMIEALTDQISPPSVVVVVSTLLIAALFNPLRRRLQTTIDRRFYRAKYDAAKTLAAFGATLRTETNLDGLTEHLIGVVEVTMRPAHVSLWLRPSDKHETETRQMTQRGGAQ